MVTFSLINDRIGLFLGFCRENFLIYQSTISLEFNFYAGTNFKDQKFLFSNYSSSIIYQVEFLNNLKTILKHVCFNHISLITLECHKNQLVFKMNVLLKNVCYFFQVLILVFLTFSFNCLLCDTYLFSLPYNAFIFYHFSCQRNQFLRTRSHDHLCCKSFIFSFYAFIFAFNNHNRNYFLCIYTLNHLDSEFFLFSFLVNAFLVFHFYHWHNLFHYTYILNYLLF